MRIPCPHCGPRDEVEFSFRGDASACRPTPEAGPDAFYDYVYTRTNPRGWTLEWWQHASGCRAWLQVRRHTVTHEIGAVTPAGPGA
jgi:heterotetrameric sarcosine oxidase delta subunit